MKKIIWTVLLLMALVGWSFGQLYEEQAQKQEAQAQFLRVKDVYGDGVLLKGKEEPDFQPAIINMLLFEGDVIKTNKNSRAEITLDKLNLLRLDQNTQIEILELYPSTLLINLIRGKIYLGVEKDNFIAEANLGLFEIKKPNCEGLKQTQISIVDQGCCYISVNQEKIELTVKKGNAGFSVGDCYNTGLITNEELVFYNHLTPEIEKLSGLRRFFRGMFDQFDIYNSGRNLVLDDSEFAYLDKYGEWRTWHDHRVWIPYKDIVIRFYPYFGPSPYYYTPYYYGRWNWYASYGWTWIPYEPWGWLTHHYGYWILVPEWGWVWVLDNTRFFRPSWCYWFWDDYYIGWYPWYPDWYYLWYRGYYNNRPYIPINMPIVTVRKEQLQAPPSERTETIGEALKKYGTVKLSERPPDIKPIYKLSEKRLAERYLVERDNLGREKTIRVPEIPITRVRKIQESYRFFNERSYQQILRKIQEPNINPQTINIPKISSPLTPPTERAPSQPKQPPQKQKEESKEPIKKKD